MADHTGVNVLQELATNDSLLSLLEDDFDPKSFATHTIQTQMVGEVLQKLIQGVDELDQELYTQVVTHYEDLLSQTTGIEALESVLIMMRTRIDSLTTAVDRISTKIIDPYQRIVSRTDQLSRLQSACDLLRRIIRILYLVKRLKSQVQGGVKEITKVAQTFSEIDQLLIGQDLSGIEVLDEEQVWLQRARKEAESQAKKMLLQGLEHLNPSQVGVALQVFYNMGQLSITLVTVLDSYMTAVQADIQNAIDPSFLLQSYSATGGGPSRTVVGGSSSSLWKASLWTQLEKLSNSLWKLYRQAHQLKVVLRKKKDPTTQVSFMTSLEGTSAEDKLNNFWDGIAHVIGVELNTAARASLPLCQVFENDFPKLVHVFSGLLSQVDKLHTETDQHSKPSSSFLYSQSGTQPENESSNHRQQALMKALGQFEKVYISRLFGRLSESVTQLFSSNSLPREDELVSFVRLLGSELQSSVQCPPLAVILVNCVTRVMTMFCTKCERMVTAGIDAVQIAGPPNFSQQKNIGIVNTLHRFQTLSQEHILNSIQIEDSAASKIRDTLEQVLRLKLAIVKPLITEVQSTLEKMIASIHKENFTVQAHMAPSDRRDSIDVPSSGFVREMISFTARISQEHLTQFNCKDDFDDMLKGVVGRVLEVYVRHVCMLRPLTDGGKMKITSDIAQVELALIPFCSKPAQVGLPHQMIRSLRRILFLAPDNFLSQPVGVGDIIPYSYIVNYLFSRAPPEVKSPHQLQNWTQEEYSQWMDRHPLETDRLAFIKATIDSYVKKNRGHNIPAILEVMENLLKQAQKL